MPRPGQVSPPARPWERSSALGAPYRFTIAQAFLIVKRNFPFYSAYLLGFRRETSEILFSQLKFLYPLKTLAFPAFSPLRFGPFPSFFPLREEMRETFLGRPYNLIQQPCGSSLGLSGGVGVNVHRGTYIRMSHTSECPNSSCTSLGAAPWERRFVVYVCLNRWK